MSMRGLAGARPSPDQLHLIAERYSWTHVNQVACALRFFFGVTLGRTEAAERIVYGRAPEKLPPVLAPEEVARLLAAVAGLRNRVALTTAYAAGLRVGEVARLKVATPCCRRGSSRFCAPTADVLHAEPVRRTMEMSAEPRDRIKVGLLLVVGFLLKSQISRKWATCSAWHSSVPLT